MEIPQILKGFRDYLPQDAIARKKIISKIAGVFERFGFAPMETPSLEPYSLLQGKIGDEEKLIYKFQDLGNREVALRYDLTVPLARVIAANPELPKPFKRYQIGNVWRAENPQKGRFREFTQCDVDIIGSSSPVADAEVIAVLAAALQNLKIGAVAVKFNNRQIIDEVLAAKDFTAEQVKGFMRLIDKMDKIGKEKVSAMLAEQGLKLSLAEYKTEMEQRGKDFITEFGANLTNLGVTNFEFDPYLARGLDYYTGTIFEFVLANKPEFGSIAGGGRYDQLIGKISGFETPAVGGSIGLDRLFAALQESGKVAPQSSADVIVFNLDANLIPEYLKMTTELRQARISAEFYYETAKIDKQFKYAEAKNAKVAVIFGPEEAKAKQVNLKNLKAKAQVTVGLADLAAKVKSML